VIVLVLTIANVLIVSLAAYRGVEYMDTPQFCGQTCHRVMQPEYEAHETGPHSRVTCVECHVGSGAQSYVYYKLNGMRQLAHFATGRYPKPVPSPVFNLRPARGTCEMCHSPETFHGDKTRVVPDYANDEKNTSNATRLVMHIGGGLPEFGLGAGIHWHTNSRIEIEFVATDPQRQQIPYVRMKDADGTVHEYRAPDADAAKIAAGEPRRMDCVDCHNRPTHDFFATPERAVDMALARGAIPTDLPFVRRQAVEVLKAAYPDREAADRDIATRLRTFYATPRSGGSPSSAAQVDRAVTATQFLYARNVFPDMNVTWGTHPTNLGHTDAPGCFRCHDDQHKSSDGRVIRQDCELCHEIQ
jgi:nitrate/TMAO reductase-like tetraheme cytochrome c subunit